MNWKPIDKCMMCGSTNITLDEELEAWECERCGCGASGANFWRLVE